MKPLILKSLALATLVLGLSSCDQDDAGGGVTPPNARVMVVHASPNAPAVDVRVNDRPAIANLAFPNNSGYTDIPSGSTNFKVSPTGTTNAVIDATVNLVANTNYSVIALDSVSKIKASVVTDDLTTPAAGKAHVRFFHLSPNAPAVNIVVANNGPTLFSNRSFNDQSNNAALANFTPVDAGSYNLEVRVASNNTVVLPLAGVPLQAGKIYTVFARGFVGGAGNQALGAQIITHN